MTLRITPSAQLDVLEAAQWYEAKRVGLGVAFVEEVDTAIARIADGPRRAALGDDGIRHTVTRRFPYAVHYVIEANEIVVLAVLHQSRDRALIETRRME